MDPSVILTKAYGVSCDFILWRVIIPFQSFFQRLIAVNGDFYFQHFKPSTTLLLLAKSATTRYKYNQTIYTECMRIVTDYRNKNSYGRMLYKC